MAGVAAYQPGALIQNTDEIQAKEIVQGLKFPDRKILCYSQAQERRVKVVGEIRDKIKKTLAGMSCHTVTS